MERVCENSNILTSFIFRVRPLNGEMRESEDDRDLGLSEASALRLSPHSRSSESDHQHPLSTIY